MRRSRLPSSAANFVKITNESVLFFYEDLILGYFSLGMRIGRCEHHKRVHAVWTAVHRRASHKYIFLVRLHRLICAQGITRTEKGPAKFDNPLQGLHGVLPWYNLKM